MTILRALITCWWIISGTMTIYPLDIGVICLLFNLHGYLIRSVYRVVRANMCSHLAEEGIKSKRLIRPICLILECITFELVPAIMGFVLIGLWLAKKSLFYFILCQMIVGIYHHCDIYKPRKSKILKWQDELLNVIKYILFLLVLTGLESYMMKHPGVIMVYFNHQVSGMIHGILRIHNNYPILQRSKRLMQLRTQYIGGKKANKNILAK